MTIDEAIKHCEEVADGFDETAQEIARQDENGVHQPQVSWYQDRASSQRQLAEWLKELVHLRNITEYIRDMVTCFEFIDSMHYNEDIIEWAESELRVDMREVNDDE